MSPLPGVHTYRVIISYFLAYQNAVSCISNRYPCRATYQRVDRILRATIRDCSLHLISFRTCNPLRTSTSIAYPVRPFFNDIRLAFRSAAEADMMHTASNPVLVLDQKEVIDPFFCKLFLLSVCQHLMCVYHWRYKTDSQR